MRPPPRPNAIFVYGTLMRGGSNVGCWPVGPTRVAAASVRGALYDLGAYPGLVAGDDRVAGECRWFADRDLVRVFDAIDELEGHRGTPDDEYRRELVAIVLAKGCAQRAWTYRYLRPLDAHRRLDPDPDGLVRWRSG